MIKYLLAELGWLDGKIFGSHAWHVKGNKNVKFTYATFFEGLSINYLFCTIGITT